MKNRSLPFLFMLLVVAAGCDTIAPKTERKPDDMLAVYESAARAYQNGDMKTAEAGFKLITQHVPRDSAAWFRLGNVYAHTDRPDEAVRAYREALVRDPARTKAWHNMGVIYLRQAEKAFLELRFNARNKDPLKAKAIEYADIIDEMLGGPAQAPAASLNREEEPGTLQLAPDTSLDRDGESDAED